MLLYFTADDRLLLVPAGHGTDDGIGSLAAPDVVAADQFIRIVRTTVAVQDAVFRKWFPEVFAQHEVVAKRKIENHTRSVPVLRDIGNAPDCPLPDGSGGDIFSVQPDGSGFQLQ